jgi:fructokinase
MTLLFGGIEGGGTKFVCAIGDENGKIIKETVIATDKPSITMPKVIEFFTEQHKTSPLAALGIASFGPVDLDPKSPTYGYITTPPKPHWGEFNFVGTMRNALHLPIGFDTDVNGAAIGEYRWGAAKGLDTFLYVTIGTGIGAGGMVAGNLMHGLIHPEMGHILIPHDKQRDPFEGTCPFHGDCFEGLANGPAMQKRWKLEKAASDLPLDHPGWDLEADYIATAFANYIMLLSPQKIVVGGGVMKTKGLLEKIHPRVQNFLGGYIKHDKVIDHIDKLIVAPGLGDRAGIAGAFALAEKAYLEKK